MDFATRTDAAEPQGPQSPLSRRATPKQPLQGGSQAAQQEERHEVRLRLPPFYILHMHQESPSQKLS